MFEEFKKFALRGNAVDLAVGIIIGAAFGSVVNSLVSDLIMPVIGAATGGLDFSNYYLPLSHKVVAGAAYLDAKKQGAVFGYGQFITVVISFLIIAACLFFIVRGMNMLMRHETEKVDAGAKAPELPADVQLLAEIRDILQSRQAV
jgi:large conductance mechanosensitive channel